MLSGCILFACCSLIAKDLREVICWNMQSFPALMDVVWGIEAVEFHFFLSEQHLARGPVIKSI